MVAVELERGCGWGWLVEEDEWMVVVDRVGSSS